MTIFKKILTAWMLTVFVLTVPACASTHSRTYMESGASQPNTKQVSVYSKQSVFSTAEDEQTEFSLKPILVIGAIVGLIALVSFVILPAVTQGIGEGLAAGIAMH